MDPRRRWLAPLLLLLAGAGMLALYLADLGRGFGNSDEVLYAEFVRAMQRGQGLFALRYHGATLLQRPPIAVTLYALVSWIAPGSPFFLRLAPALLSFAAAATCGVLVWRATRRVAPATLAAFACAGAPTYFAYGRALLSDPPFILATVIALGGALSAVGAEPGERPRGLRAVGIGLGLAFATKSLAAAIPTVALAPWIAHVVRRDRERGALRELAIAGALFAALAAPYYLISSLVYGRRFLYEHIGFNLADRAAGRIAGVGLGGPAAYLVTLWRQGGPAWFAVLVAGPVAAAMVALRVRDARLGLAASVALTTLLLLSLLGTRLPHYLLLYVPPGAVAVGLLAARLPARLHPPWTLPAAAVALVALGLARQPVDANLLSSPATMALGRAVGADSADRDLPLCLVDLYAPALSYYADRPAAMWTTDGRFLAIVGGIDLFRAADVVRPAPPLAPPPLPRGRSLLVVIPEDRLDRIAGWLVLDRPLARAGGCLLARATVR